MLKLSIIMVTHARPVLFSNAVKSLLAAFAQKNSLDFKIHIGIHGKPEDQILDDDYQAYSARPDIEFYSFSPKQTPPEIRNSLIKSASDADWFFFCDDDVQVPETIFKSFEEKMEINPHLLLAGGPNLTFLTADAEEVWQGRFLASRFLNPVFFHRYSSEGEKLTKANRYYCLCNLFVKNVKAVTFRHLQFCGEELQLLDDVKNANDGEWLYSPDLFVYHHRRKSPDMFYKQLYSYGRGRGIFIKNNSLGFLNPCFKALIKILLFFPSRTNLKSRVLKCLVSYLSGVKAGCE